MQHWEKICAFIGFSYILLGVKKQYQIISVAFVSCVKVESNWSKQNKDGKWIKQTKKKSKEVEKLEGKNRARTASVN